MIVQDLIELDLISEVVLLDRRDQPPSPDFPG
jgi:hypothetical protein